MGGPVKTLSCENSRFSSLFAPADVARRGTTTTNKCLHNISGSHGVPHPNLFNFTFILVDFTKVLCSSVNELQQNSNVSSREEYISPILIVL